jgi:hypothetical protein
MDRYFHILGIDIMLNTCCEPIVLELNDRPSMSVTYDIEKPLKVQLVKDALNIVTVDGSLPSEDVSPGGWEILLPDRTTAFGKSAGDILARCCFGTNLSPRQAVIKRLGYAPSASRFRPSFRKTVGLPPLQQ